MPNSPRIGRPASRIPNTGISVDEFPHSEGLADGMLRVPPDRLCEGAGFHGVQAEITGGCRRRPAGRSLGINGT